MLAACLQIAPAARASAPDSVAQDDATIVCRWHDPGRAIEQIRDAGFTHLRINVTHAPGPGGGGLVACSLPATLADYDRAVALARDAGLVPQLTLLWSHQADPAATAAWMADMAAHFAPVVRRFSVLNEPDLTIPAGDDCDPATVSQLVRSGPLSALPRVRWVKRYLGRHGRPLFVLRTGGWYPHHGYGLRRVRAYRWVAGSAADSQDSSAQQVTTVRRGCLKLQRGRIYHQIFDAAAPAIRAAAPGAQVLAGETSPVAGLGLFVHAALPLDADGWAHHCYQWNLTPDQPTGGFGIGDTATVQALVGMPLYYTECGYPNADSQWNQARYGTLFTHDDLPAAYARMWQFARAQGVREMSQFGWCPTPAGRWDTSLMAGPGCDTGPEYGAVRDVLAGWGQ